MILNGANLRYAYLRYANLIGAIGLKSSIDFLNEYFEKTGEGYIVYKIFNLAYKSPCKWVIKKGAIINENVDANRTIECGCGINVATKNWFRKNGSNLSNYKVWRLLIKWEWLSGVVVPYNTNGKIRCERAMLLDEIEI